MSERIKNLFKKSEVLSGKLVSLTDRLSAGYSLYNLMGVMVMILIIILMMMMIMMVMMIMVILLMVVMVMIMVMVTWSAVTSPSVSGATRP